TPTAAPLDIGELRGLATTSYRTYAVIELDATGQNLTEFPIGDFGTIGLRFQDSLNALAQEESGKPTVRGAIPANITTDVQMNVVELRAASFAVVIATDNRSALFDNAQLVEPTLMRLLKLVDAGHDPDTVIGALRDYGRRARSKVVDLLRAITQAESGFGIIVTSKAGDPAQARLNAGEVRAV